jgi:23S rRNA pseudouridine1911/1915/1917 synthase
VILRMSPQLAGLRADVAISTAIPRLSRSKAARILRQGEAVGRAGRRIRPATRVLAEEEVSWWREPLVEPELPEQIGILARADCYVALNKPAGLPIHPTARYVRYTVTEYLRRHFTVDGVYPHPAHRLDRETSGALLCYFPPWGRYFKTLFLTRAVHKAYLAVVHGRVADETFLIDAPLRLSPSARIGVKMEVHRDGMPSQTEVRVVARGDAFSLVEARPLTGRQHQIRVHLTHAGYPIVGDKIYGQDEALFQRSLRTGLTDEDRARLMLARQALHAWYLAVPLPDGQPLELHAPLPDDLAEFIQKNIGTPPTEYGH